VSAATSAPSARRPTQLCRSWLFVNGADEQALADAPLSGSDVLIQELEDFTPPALRPKARELSAETLAAWRATGATVAVRVNPLNDDGMADLEAVMRGGPDIIALPKVSDPEHIEQLAMTVAALEESYGLAPGSTELLPNIESALGLVKLGDIVSASPRVQSCLMASEDMAADLGAVRAPDGLELSYARQRFLLECVAIGVMPIDYPYTWQDNDGARRDTLNAQRLGYRAKSAVAHAHSAIINDVLTPSSVEVAEARRIIAAFDTAQASGRGRAELDGNLVEVPTFTNAQRLLKRADELAALA
jgi:citrate lyase subunit beta/citryl-CoA lyase